MDHSDTPRNPERLIDLLSQQRDVYQRLRELADQQRAVITGDRPEALLQILRERHVLVGLLTRLNEQLAPFHRDPDGPYAGFPPERRAQADRLLEEINGLVRVILRTDHEDGALLASRKCAVGEQLAAASQAGSVSAAYTRQALDTVSAADVSG